MISRFVSAKKQSQFKAKQTQYYLAPRFIWGLKTGLKKQSQFAGGQINTRRVKTMVYGVFGGWGLRKNKANSKPISAFSRKSEALSSP